MLRRAPRTLQQGAYTFCQPVKAKLPHSRAACTPGQGYFLAPGGAANFAKGMPRCAQHLPFGCLVSGYYYFPYEACVGFMLLVDTQWTSATDKICMPVLLRHLLA